LLDIEKQLAKAKSENNVQSVEKLKQTYKILERTTNALFDAQSESSQCISSSNSLEGESETLVQVSFSAQFLFLFNLSIFDFSYPGRVFLPPDLTGSSMKDAGKSPYPSGKRRKSLERGSSITTGNCRDFFRWSSK